MQFQGEGVMRKIVAPVFGFAVVALAGAGVHSQAAVPWQLIEHTVAADLRGAYDVVAVDMNNDRRTDLLAVAGGTQALTWFENPLSSEARLVRRSPEGEGGSAKEESWTRHEIASGIPGIINAAPFDIDRDGIPEVWRYRNRDR